jgi:TRAP-type C4-dicarboxylate transport system substrate-binding protein
MSIQASRRKALGLATVAAALCRPHITRAAVRTLRLGHVDPDDGLFGEGSRAFAAAVAADPLLGGALQIAVQGGGRLGDDLTLAKGCMDGTAELALCSASVVGRFVKQVDYLYAPFLFADVVAARAALDGAVGVELAASMKQKGLNVLAWGDRGMAHIAGNRPVHNLADLQGLKIAVPPSEVMIGGFRALGTEPGSLPFPALREAFRTGQVQALQTSIATLEPSKLYEVVKYINMTAQGYNAAAFIASSDVIEDLTPPQVKALGACAAKGAAMTRQVASAAEVAGVTKLAALGMTVVSDVDVAALRAASRPYLESLAAGDSGGFVKRLIAAGA